MEAQCHAIQPRRLKDFLLDQNLPFPHYTRKSPLSIFIKAVKSSSILRRSISRRFSKKNSSLSSCLPEPTMARSTSVTVKDILRWKSFRDLGDIEVNNVAPHFKVESPSRCSTTTSEETPRSSWCDSDFTVGDSPIWCRGSSGDIEVTRKKDFHINVSGGARPHQTARDPKDRIMHEEEEQFSPISVLDFTQHEETFSSFHQSLANMERRNILLKQQILDFENLIEVEDLCLVNKNVELDDVESFEIEEKAIQLMDHVKTTSSTEELDVTMDVMLLDFFRDELSTTKEVKGDGKFESRVLSMAKSWVKGEDDGSLEWELEGTRDVCIGEMWKSGNWKDFEDEKQEIAIEIEKMMLNHLLDELSIDLLNI
ncbi:hypothetical protein CTI12_AA000660 [Artemisia annua]|uniref:DUF4378 domain-containing protein n=1 Tax=Artemisia annua TaxID=35608 RepID=A0A2U1QPM0_ARTAN|nr:hypothetical protein CTI12_AA000660 [Artemisia annua]